MEPNYTLDPDTITEAPQDFCDVDITLPELKFRRSVLFTTIKDKIKITPVDLQQLIEAGMNVARFKPAHTTKTDKIELLTQIDEAAVFVGQKYALPRWPLCTCMELKTFTTYTGVIEKDEVSVKLKAGSEVTLSYDLSIYDKCNKDLIFVDNPHLGIDAKPDMEIVLAQEDVVLKCTEIINDKTIKCEVVMPGNLRGLVDVCLRGAIRNRRPLAEKDYNLIKFALEYEVDILLINYVIDGITPKEVKKFIGTNVKRPFILCGISTGQCLENLDDVLKEADGILISRHLLQYELSKTMVKRMFRIQKYIIGKCREAGKPCFICGDVFRMSMKFGIIIQREIDDVAHALLDGVSGFVLGDQYANSDYLVAVLDFLNKLCRNIEPYNFNKINLRTQLNLKNVPINAAMGAAISAAVLANTISARLLIIPSVSGRTVSMVACLNTYSIIIAITTRKRIYKVLRTSRGVIPFLYKTSRHSGSKEETGSKDAWGYSVRRRVDFALTYAVNNRWITTGDPYVTLEKATEESPFCDSVRYWHVALIKRATIECAEYEPEPTVPPTE